MNAGKNASKPSSNVCGSQVRMPTLTVVVDIQVITLFLVDSTSLIQVFLPGNFAVGDLGITKGRWGLCSRSR